MSVLVPINLPPDTQLTNKYVIIHQIKNYRGELTWAVASNTAAGRSESVNVVDMGVLIEIVESTLEQIEKDDAAEKKLKDNMKKELCVEKLESEHDEVDV